MQMAEYSEVVLKLEGSNRGPVRMIFGGERESGKLEVRWGCYGEHFASPKAEQLPA